MKRIKRLTIFTILLLITFISVELVFTKNEEKNYKENNNIEYKASTTKPSKPNRNHLPATSQDGYVYIKCINYPDANPKTSNRTHSGYISLDSSSGGWSFSDVYENDGKYGDDAPSDAYPWMSDLIIDSDWYLNWWNNKYSSTEGTHHLSNSNYEIRSTFVSDGSNWYFLTEDFPLVVWTTQEVPSTKYTIVLEYYTNNLSDGSITISNNDAKVGDQIIGSDISKLFSNSYQGNDDYIYSGSYVGLTDDNNKIIVGEKTDIVTLTKNTNTNVIILRYDRHIVKIDKLTVTKKANNTTPEIGEEFKYTIRISNASSHYAKVKVKDILPFTLDFIAAGDGGEYDKDSHTVTWEDVTIPANGSKELSLYVKANTVGEIDNEVEIELNGEKVKGTAKINAIQKADSNDEKITVTWYDGYSDSPLIKKEVIDRGADYDELYPIDPTREEYIFTGWGNPVTDSYGNISITAQWKPINSEDKDDKTDEENNKKEETTNEKNPITMDNILMIIVALIISSISIMFFVIKKKSFN